MASSLSSTAISEAVNQCINKVNNSYVIEPKQLEAIINLLRGYDTLAILPTSYGKSMIFQLIPSVLRLLYEDQSPHCHRYFPTVVFFALPRYSFCTPFVHCFFGFRFS